MRVKLLVEFKIEDNPLRLEAGQHYVSSRTSKDT